MAGGLVALLDDIAVIAKMAAASLDDVAAATGKAATKAAGVVIDDAAVTPGYVVGLTPDRELPIIAKIAMGSLRNKILILLPAALLLSAFAPWAITPILMLGGAFLCFEGAEKLIKKLTGAHDDKGVGEITDPKELEDRQVAGAIRTDMILSAEIMAIALAELADQTLVMEGIVLAAVALTVTIAVYGTVALIVKMDDIGLHLAKSRVAATRAIGRAMVQAMPWLLTALTWIGTAAMIWVGGGIIIHGLEVFGFKALASGLHDFAHRVGGASPVGGSVIEWIVNATGAAIVGLIVGGIIVAALKPFHKAH